MEISGKVDKLPISKQKLVSIQKKAEKIALQAGKIILQYQSKIKVIKSKANLLDIATSADLASEKYILSELKKYYPLHSSYSEETGSSKKSSDYLWVIDPIDGTKEFFRGQFNYTVNIALEYKSELIVGVVYYPKPNYLYSTSLNSGVLLNNKKISVSKQNKLSLSMIGSHLIDLKPGENYVSKWKPFANISEKVYRLRSNPSDIFNLCSVSQGAYEAAFISYFVPNFWYDIAPGILMVSEAGGKITTTKGNKVTKNNFQHEGVLASNGLIHDKLLELINKK